MKQALVIACFLVFTGLANAQVIFKTIVPQQPVTVGESFQVQYIIEDGEKITHFIAPVFNNFRIVSGPNIYEGSVASFSGTKPLRNTVYTLEAIKPGRFVIPGSTASVNGEFIKSDNAVIEVITPGEAIKRFNREAGVNSEYFLRPGENAYEKIRQNLFLKVQVDKKNCYTGEPVLATFKLYSRLESKSDRVKNPGFYGFTVYDMVNLTDKFVTTENVQGKVFDVHTIRKVQLFPLQAGTYTIDPMEIKNTVEFSRSAVYRKTEQEIVEGVLDNSTIPHHENAAIFETSVSTEPLTIRVKPFPANDKPVSFNGAVGMFSVSASLSSDTLARNEEGFLEITIKGNGNFIQLNAPSILWPGAVEGFEPQVKELLDKHRSPVTGSKVFHYPFVSARPGTYDIPAVEFSYFNPDSGRYKTIKTAALRVNVSNQQKKVMPAAENKEARNPGGNGRMIMILILAGVVAGLFAGILGLRKRRKEKITSGEIIEPVLSVEQMLAPPRLLVLADDRDFYSSLREAIWLFFTTRYGIGGSEMNKEVISSLLKNEKMSTAVVADLQDILLQCEAGIFTNASVPADKARFLEKTKTLLQEIRDASL